MVFLSVWLSFFGGFIVIFVVFSLWMMVILKKSTLLQPLFFSFRTQKPNCTSVESDFSLSWGLHWRMSSELIVFSVTHLNPCGPFMCYTDTRERIFFLFNDALNTFYLRLYGVRHMVKDHSDSEKGNPLPPHRLLLSINSKGSFICTIPQTG